jgi:indolepyruvate ferredoxin oxidoreductase, beta subunit
MKSYNIYISGVGGQGIIKTSIVIGEAAMKSGMNVVMSEIHGMSQRGGEVSTEIKIGDAHSPIIENGSANLLLSFEPLEALRSLPKISKNTVAVINKSTIVPFNIHQSKIPYPDLDVIFDELKSKIKKLYAFNAEEMAKDAGNILSMNMVLLGAVSGVSEFPVIKKYLIHAMKENLPEKTLNTNLKAFTMGFEQVYKPK